MPVLPPFDVPAARRGAARFSLFLNASLLYRCPDRHRYKTHIDIGKQMVYNKATSVAQRLLLKFQIKLRVFGQYRERSGIPP